MKEVKGLLMSALPVALGVAAGMWAYSEISKLRAEA